MYFFITTGQKLQFKKNHSLKISYTFLFYDINKYIDMNPQEAKETWSVNNDILKGKHQAILEEST